MILEYYTKTKVHLTITENRTSLLTAKKRNGAYFVRLSKIFLHANETVVKDLALFVVRKSKLTENVKCFLTSYPLAERKVKKEVKIKTEGKIFNLQDIFERLNLQYFEGQISAKISWGKGSSARTVRTRQLGSYSEKDNLIRINPVLDKREVPQIYIEFIVYHEMLHAFLGVKKINKRRSVHSKEFRERERLFSHYNECIKWEKENRFSAILRA
ncbi:MAG: hypothetical protein OHK0040_00200 [bacterium]